MWGAVRMKDLHRDWAAAVRCFDLIIRDRASGGLTAPSTLAQLLSGHTFVIAGPAESFSADVPIWHPSDPADAEFLPIDALYGRYVPEHRSITIYVNRIGQDANRFGAEFEDLLTIVRIHEYFHALVHLGVAIETELADLSALMDRQDDGRRGFIDMRTERFHMIDDESHEFMAQAMTRACLTRFAGSDSERMLAIFDRLEKLQPPHYHVPSHFKERIARVEWPLVLRAARQEADACRPDGFSLRQGLLRLIEEFCERESGLGHLEWSVEVDNAATDRLKRALFADDRAAAVPSAGDQPAFLVDRFAGLKVEVFAREHGMPHFRVKCGEGSANYTIEDCTQLNGALQRQYRVIREWHAAHKQKLIDAWNSSRPSDCPIGEYRGK